MLGFDTLCGYCGQQGLVFGWRQLTVYDKEKDDKARGLTQRVHAEFHLEPVIPGLDGLTREQGTLGPDVYDEDTTASERAQHKALNSALAARLEHSAKRPPTETPGDMRPRPAN
eukprot:8208327-Heterocapsa_arctica.AAC.1